MLPKAILIVFASLQLFSCQRPYETAEKNFAETTALNKTYDAVIIPGYPAEEGKWSFLMKIRVVWSFYLYQQGIARNIIYSGSAVHNAYEEGKLMALYGLAMGIPKENVFIEDKAEHSFENLFYGYKLARSKGFQSLAIATDPIQTMMLSDECKSHNVDVVPIARSIMDSLVVTVPDYEVDKESTVMADFTPLSERESWLVRLNRSTGRHLKGVNWDE